MQIAIDIFKVFLVNVSIAICMDINPDEEANAEFNEFELGHYLRKEEVDLLVLICCWNDSDPKNDSKKNGMKTIEYWMIRLLPLTAHETCGELNPKPRGKKRVGVLCCDRVGKEDDTVYVGMSCWFATSPLQVGEFAGKREEKA